MTSCSIDGKDMYETYGLILGSKEIEPPEAQTKFVEVPCRNGAIDLTEAVTGSVKYNDRTIKMKFIYKGTEAPTVASNVYKAIHGKRLDIIFGDDPTFHYTGRIECKDLTSLAKSGKLTVEVEAEPFKWDNTSSAVDWEWDVFDFEEGLINELGQLIVDGSTTVTLVCRRAMEWPTFTTSSAMTMTYKGVTYDLAEGSQKLYRVFLEEGENEFTFTGNGTVSIDYVGGEI